MKQSSAGQIRHQTKRISTCSMMSALCVVIMWLGAILELGMYAAPLFAGLCLIPVGQKYGAKYHLTMWLASGLLCMLLVPNVEQNLLYLGIFGWYPVLRPRLERLPALLRIICKVIIFNVVIVLVEGIVLVFLAPEALSGWMIALLLAMANVLFVLYDFLIPRLSILTGRIARLL